MNYQQIKLIEDDYERAYQLVSLKFKDKTDKEGEPYINHLIRVSEKLNNKNTKIAGLLHDIVEDTDITFEDLKDLNFNEEIIELVRIVTNDPNKKETYHEKITSIIETNNIEAIKLKYSDMSDNSNLERLNKLEEEIKQRLINKYQPEIIRLESILKERGEII